MKFSTQEEYGLRFLIRLGRFYRAEKSLTIPELSNIEGISEPTTAKLLRKLRLGGFLVSERGHQGGYTLSRPPSEIIIGDVLACLGGRLYHDKFCESYSGDTEICTNTVDCSVRSLWTVIQTSVDKLVNSLTLEDLMGKEEELFRKVEV